MNNLELWNKVEKTNPRHTKNVKSGGRSLTAINAQQQIKNATSEFGKYGDTWGLKDIKLEYVNGLINNQMLAVAQGFFYYPNGGFDIGSSILVQSWIASKSYNKVDDDFLKKLETDMLTKSLSKLGFNADVFLGKFDDNKYVARMNAEFNAPPAPKKVKLTSTMLKALVDNRNIDDIRNAFKTCELSTDQKETLTELGKELKTEK